MQQQLSAWNEPAPGFERSLLPHKLFELFLKNTEMERICIESTNYVRLKGNHIFTMTVEKLKTFLTILLVSGYAGLPRQEMFWERQEHCHNIVVSAMMTKTDFLESKRYLQVAGNNAVKSSDKFAKVRPLFNAINEQCIFILNYQPTHHASAAKSMVPYFGRHGAKQYIHVKPIKFGFKFWVMTTPLWYFIQFRSYAVKDSILQEYENIGLDLGASVVANSFIKLLMMQASNYHIVMDNYFTSPAFLSHLSAMGVPATGTVGANQMEKAPFRYKVKMNKEKHRS